MLNYRYTQNAGQIPCSAGAQIQVESFMTWTSQVPNDKSTKLVFTASGEVKGRQRAETESWVFDWPTDQDLSALESGLKMIERHVETRSRDGRRKEAFVDIYSWLRVGWVDQGEKWYGYVQFRKGEEYIEALYSDIPALFKFRNSLKTISGL